MITTTGCILNISNMSRGCLIKMVAYPKLFYIMQVLTIYLKHSDHNSIGQWQPMLKDFFWGGGRSPPAKDAFPWRPAPTSACDWRKHACLSQVPITEVSVLFSDRLLHPSSAPIQITLSAIFLQACRTKERRLTGCAPTPHTTYG